MAEGTPIPIFDATFTDVNEQALQARTGFTFEQASNAMFSYPGHGEMSLLDLFRESEEDRLDQSEIKTRRCPFGAMIESAFTTSGRNLRAVDGFIQSLKVAGLKTNLVIQEGQVAIDQQSPLSQEKKSDRRQYRRVSN